MTKYKKKQNTDKTKCKSDKMQKDRMQIRQNTKQAGAELGQAQLQLGLRNRQYFAMIGLKSTCRNGQDTKIVVNYPND